MTDKLPIEERKTPYTPDVISRLTQNWFAGQPDAQILLTTDKRATGDNAPYTGIGFGLHDFMAMLRERDSLAAQLAAIRAETVEECAKRLDDESEKWEKTAARYYHQPKPNIGAGDDCVAELNAMKSAARIIRSLQHAEPQQ